MHMSETVLTVITSALTSGLYGLCAGGLAGELLRRQRDSELVEVVTSTHAVVRKAEWADNALTRLIVFVVGVLLFYYGLRTNSLALFPLTGGFGLFVIAFVGACYWRRHRGAYPSHGGF
jgi:hypothetical protein